MPLSFGRSLSSATNAAKGFNFICAAVGGLPLDSLVVLLPDKRQMKRLLVQPCGLELEPQLVCSSSRIGIE